VVKFGKILASPTIKFKMIVLNVGLILTFLFCMVFALMQMSKIGEELEEIAEVDIPLTEVVTKITIYQLEQAVSFERAMRFGEVMGNDKNTQLHFRHAIEKFDELTGKVEVAIVKGRGVAGGARIAAYTDKARSEFKHVDEVLKKVAKEHASFIKNSQHAFTLLANGDLHEAMKVAELVEKEEDNLDHELESLLFELEEFTAEAAKTAEHDEQLAYKLLSIVTIVVVLIAAFFAFFITRGIINGLNRSVAVAESIASGNLKCEVYVTSSDELGKLQQAMKTMRDNLYEMVSEMNRSSVELASSTEELSAVTEQINQSIHVQQGQVQQSATAITELSATIQEVARNATSTAESANNANRAASDGQMVVQKTVEQIKNLASGVEGAALAINQVGLDSDSIGSVIDVIKDIAEQTNLLALNAAIEAARAGEQGRGFAVVADEVRTLAQRTQESTQVIEEMIVKLQSGAKNAVKVMEDSRDQAQLSVNQAALAGGSLDEIASAVIVISDMNHQIASAAEEQSSVSEEISQNIQKVNLSAEQNSTAMNEASTSTVNLSRLAVSLQQMISKFSI